MNTEQKQSINLSPYADSVLREDREQFSPDMTFTGFLNAVITRYNPLADASIHNTLEKTGKKLNEALERNLESESAADPPAVSFPRRAFSIKKDTSSQIYPSSIPASDLSALKHLSDSHRSALVSLLCREAELSLVQKSRSYESGKTFTFRLNNQNYNWFFGNGNSSWPDACYYNGHFSRYLKAVVEEYCSLTRFQRETVFFQDFIEIVEAAIGTGKMLRVEMYSPLTGKDAWDVRPYAILPDASRLYHYLIGKSVQAGGLKRDEKIASIRLSRIRKLTMQSKKTGRSGVLTAAEKKEIRKKISVNSVAFLIGEEEEVVVRLTENGRRLYESALFLRPVLHCIDEKGMFHFHCTSMQAGSYFLRFGADAEILSPESLRESFADTYRKAANLYADA